MVNRLYNSALRKVKEINIQKGFKGVLYVSLMTAIVISCVYLFSFSVTADRDGVKYLIGMSQCNLGEPYRIQMNEELLREAQKYPDIKIIFTDAVQDNEKQIEDVKKLMKLGIDLLIISPNEYESQTSIISEAYKSIPVIVLDRKISSDDYTLFIGADNYVIGQRAGEYVKSLSGESEVNVVEIMGLPGSMPTSERSKGFRESISDAPNIQVVDYLVANWLRDFADDVFASYLTANPDLKIDVVYSHNDPMALGAYRAASRMGKASDIVFMGIDGLDGEEGGLNLIKNNILDITFIYPTGGKEAIEYARDILSGKAVDNKQVILNNIQVDKSNYDLYMK